ncbi:MAG TPA: hypothetical protein VMR28_01080 [Candidatus Saccharimonadales bacterium]|nr:hypothetical protein [Candidatus Saccharimonadales bacterium]
MATAEAQPGATPGSGEYRPPTDVGQFFQQTVQTAVAAARNVREFFIPPRAFTPGEGVTLHDMWGHSFQGTDGVPAFDSRQPWNERFVPTEHYSEHDQ